MSTVKEALGPRLSHTCIAFMISLIFCSYPLWFSVSWAWAVVFQNPPECGPQTLPILCLLSHSWILQLRNLQTLWRMLTELHHTQWTIVSTTLGATIWTRFWSTTTTRNIPLCGNSRMHLKGSLHHGPFKGLPIPCLCGSETERSTSELIALLKSWPQPCRYLNCG